MVMQLNFTHLQKKTKKKQKNKLDSIQNTLLNHKRAGYNLLSYAFLWSGPFDIRKI